MSDYAPDFVVSRDGQPDNTFARFHMKAVQNEFRSGQEGRPIFDNLEYVEIHVPGDRMTLVDRRVKEDDKRRWPNQYAAFKAEREQVADGYPLENWPGVDRAQVEELKHFRIHTVEQLANLPDERLTFGTGARTLRESAQRFLKTTAGSAPVEALAAEVARQAVIIEELKADLAVANRIVAELKGASNEPAA
jgi:hypothetical protein